MRSTVSVVYCDNYDPQNVYEAVSRALNALGGVGNFVSQGEKILVKPNFLTPASPDKPITTHPSVINAVTRILAEGGYSFKCGDSPGFGSCETAFEKLGLDKACIAPMDRAVRKNGFLLASDAAEVDAIIGVCKMKTHMLEKVTGAVKNMYGLIYGKNKALGHVSYPNAVNFARMLARLHKATPQRLHIMDGIVAMEGNGPASGTPVAMNVILASADPVALDAVFCRLIALDPRLVPTNTCGARGGIGTYREEEIDILFEGEPTGAEELFARFGKADFDVRREKEAPTMLGMMSRVTGRLGNRPRIDPAKCLKCGVCVEHCPVEGHAVRFANGRDQVPVYDYKKCIRCYCCQEICPGHAIYSGRK